MKAEVYAALEQLIPAGSRVICAVSGGADSVCLLHLLLTWGRDRGLDITAAHFNHQLRGAESDRDQTFVQDLCRRLGVACVIGSGDVAGRRAAAGESTEEAARVLRYAFLRQAAGDTALIATAHTADDNLETLLINLLRGTSLPGLTGIPARAGNVIRPLLNATRNEVLAYLRENGLPHVEDSSNASDAYLRNRLRHQVVPLLKQEAPNLAASALAMTRRLSEDNALLDRLASQALAECMENGELSAPRLLALDPALQGRAALLWLRQNGVDGSSRHVQAVLSLAASANPSARCSLPGNLEARRVYDRLVLAPAENACAPVPETVLSVPGVTQAGGWAFDCRFLDLSETAARPAPDTLVLNPTALEAPLRVRHRQTGDRIRLPGGSRTVKKLLIDRKVPALERDSVPVLASGDAALALWLDGRWFGQQEPRQSGGTALTIQIRKLGPDDGP